MELKLLCAKLNFVKLWANQKKIALSVFKKVLTTWCKNRENLLRLLNWIFTSLIKVKQNVLIFSKIKVSFTVRRLMVAKLIKKVVWSAKLTMESIPNTLMIQRNIRKFIFAPLTKAGSKVRLRTVQNCLPKPHKFYYLFLIRQVVLNVWKTMKLCKYPPWKPLTEIKLKPTRKFVFLKIALW